MENEPTSPTTAPQQATHEPIAPGMSQDSSQLDSLLELARAFARAPISGIKVGALAIGESGRCYPGANMEFVGVPLHASLHAEQSAVLNAWMHGEPAIHSLIVSEAPCGHCRQFLLELSEASKLIITAKSSSRNLSELIPEPFAKTRAKGDGLLDSPPNKVRSSQQDINDRARLAIEAACHSYTPYTHAPEGFVIETEDGQYFTGRSAESIAFNPSVPAVISALNQMNLSAHREASIRVCVHAGLAGALPHSLAFSESVIRSISGSANVECVRMQLDILPA